MLLEFQRDFAAVIGARAEGPMRIYRNTSLGGCVDALRDNFPAVARLLGDEMFEAIAAEHASQCPPRRPVLALYGARFSDWLEEQPWVREVPYLPDVARIERLHIEALFATDEESLRLDELQGREDWLALRLALHPAARFDWLTSPARSIWQSQRDELDGELEFDWQAEGILLTRPGLEVQPTALDRAGHRFLFGIRLGESVGDAAIATASLYPETDIGSLFASLVNAGAFAASSHRS
ncbi:MAG: putative DNA-binding domain-containing protein [Sphingomonas sp.]|nr:putative DNA-binding domain-containing protein [Sphingomonas sp.]